MSSLLRSVTPLLFLFCASCADDSSSSEKNLVLIVVDTLRADHMSLHGYERPTTPKLDAFASERGVVFDNARSSASWTKASVASIFTGLDPRQHRVQKHMDSLHSSFRTLAQSFGEAGWQTHGIQSNLYLLSGFGFDKGFIDYEDSLTPIGGGGGGTIAKHNTSTGEVVNERALEWLDERDATNPFFLYVHHYEPHHEYLAEEASFLPPLTAGPDAARRAALADAEMGTLFAGVDQLTAADIDYLAARYDSEILLQDRLLGELLDGLEQRGLLENSVVVITSDHGEEFLEHGGVSHRNDMLFDELLKVPLVLVLPGTRAARRATPVGLGDLGCTLLELCGVKDLSFPGHSFAAGVRAGANSARDVVSHGMFPKDSLGSLEDTELASLVRGEWKLIHDLLGGPSMLFNLESDPGEQNDLAAVEPDRVRELEQGLLDYLDSRGGVGGELPPESDAVIRRREDLIEENLAELNALGYGGVEDEPDEEIQQSSSTAGDEH